MSRYSESGERGDGRSGRGSYTMSGERPSRSSSKKLTTESRSGDDKEFRSQAKLSSFYRERFGSHSPEEYMNLRLSHMSPKLGKDDIKDILEREFKSFSPFEIKIVRNPQDDQRLAYVNFQRPEAARKIRRTLTIRLSSLLGHRLHIDPAGVIRDQEGKYIPDRYHRALQAEHERRRPSPSRSHRRRSSPSNYDRRSNHRNPQQTPPPVSSYSTKRDSQQTVVRDQSRTRSVSNNNNNNNNNNTSLELTEWKLKECVEEGANRTLFIGNMPADIKEAEIRRHYERYGVVEDVDIKTPVDTNAAYAFVQFQNLDEALTAKYEEQDRPMRANTARTKIGYGKPLVSSRLWVGGLGSWTATETLVNEFDRYGLIEDMEHRKGASHALITFADSAAATDACRAMRGFPLGGRDRCILVDYVKDNKRPATEENDRKRRRSASPSDRYRDRERDREGRRKAARRSPPQQQQQQQQKARRGPRTPPDSPPPSPSPSPKNREKQHPSPVPIKAATIEELQLAVAPCWIGALVLKKSSYSIRLHKVSGEEELIDEHMREPGSGQTVKLHIMQRLPFASQSGLIDRFAATPRYQLAYLLAVEQNIALSGQEQSVERPLKALVSYLLEKKAAGVVSLRDGAVLYVFPRCPLAQTLLEPIAPQMTILSSAQADSCLFLALAKNGLRQVAPPPLTAASTGEQPNGK